MNARQPDVAGAVLALDQAMIALAVAKSTLLGETSRPVPGVKPLLPLAIVDLTAAEASPANPYGSTKLASLRGREHYDERPASMLGVADDPGAGMWTGNFEAIEDARNGGRAPYADRAAGCPVCESVIAYQRGLYEDEDGLHPCVDPWHTAHLQPPAPYGHQSLQPAKDGGL